MKLFSLKSPKASSTKIVSSAWWGRCAVEGSGYGGERVEVRAQLACSYFILRHTYGGLTYDGAW